MPWIILGIITSYLIGSVPTAYIFCRLLKGVDIRKYGSGNVGATNAMRILGRAPGITVLALDIFKGFSAVFFLGNFLADKTALISDSELRLLLGFFCIVGHNWTVFLQFKGGKGIATSLGLLIGLALKVNGLPVVLGMLILSWFILFLLTRIVSLASIVAALLLPLYSFLFKQPRSFIVASVLLSMMVILRHKSNIIRLLKNKESRLF